MLFQTRGRSRRFPRARPRHDRSLVRARPAVMFGRFQARAGRLAALPNYDAGGMLWRWTGSQRRSRNDVRCCATDRSHECLRRAGRHAASLQRTAWGAMAMPVSVFPFSVAPFPEGQPRSGFGLSGVRCSVRRLIRCSIPGCCCRMFHSHPVRRFIALASVNFSKARLRGAAPTARTA